MTDRPYHHGHLWGLLLAEAERVLREQGVEGLSLRDLARSPIPGRRRAFQAGLALGWPVRLASTAAA